MWTSLDLQIFTSLPIYILTISNEERRQKKCYVNEVSSLNNFGSKCCLNHRKKHLGALKGRLANNLDYTQCAHFSPNASAVFERFPLWMKNVMNKNNTIIHEMLTDNQVLCMCITRWYINIPKTYDQINWTACDLEWPEKIQLYRTTYLISKHVLRATQESVWPLTFPW